MNDAIRPHEVQPCSALLLHRDYFARLNASLFSFFSPQGLLCPGQMHLYLAFLLHRDYFARLNASLFSFFSPQGLLCPGQMHLYLAFLFHRDYSGRPDASLSSSFSPQGLFRPVRCIPPPLFFTTGIISAGQISPIAESISARPFRHLHIVPRQNNCTGRQLPTTD